MDRGREACAPKSFNLKIRNRKKGSMLICTRQLEDVPELIHRIQFLLPMKEAARTCVLSKSWLYAWYTIPTLRFTKKIVDVIDEKEEKDYLSFIESTMVRYIESDIPIQSFDLHFVIRNSELASLVENWIHHIISKTCLKELSLKIFTRHVSRFTFPDEMFSGENLITMSLTTDNYVWICKNPVIKCFSLRVLELLGLMIYEDALDKILSTCTLLEKINLSFRKKLETVKVKSLRCLRELKITGTIDILEIDDVPGLRLFHHHKLHARAYNSITFNVGSLASVTELSVGVYIMTRQFLDLIGSKFPVLESLTLAVGWWCDDNKGIRCASLKRLTLRLSIRMKVDIQIYAPQLLYFCFDGRIVPSLMFPSSVPEQIKLKISFTQNTGDSCFGKIRDLLNISSKFDIEIIDHRHDCVMPLNIDIDDLRSRLPFPATNVQQLSFTRNGRSEKHIQYFIALFSVCHPDYVHLYGDKPFTDNMFYQQMVRLMIDNKTPDLKDVDVKNPCNGEWVTLTDYSSFPQAHWYCVDFKLHWCS